MLRDIKRTFKRAIFFGFTGTPIHDENSKKMSTTTSLFGNELHRYSIADGIRDGNVLGFDPVKICTYKDRDLREVVGKDIFDKYVYEDQISMAGYKDESGKFIKGIEDYLPNSQYNNDNHREAVVKNILDNWHILSADSKFHAIFATSSIPEAIRYYRIFKSQNSKLKITALFDPSDNNSNDTIDKIDGIREILEDYNAMYNKSFTIPTYANFKTDIQMRLAHKDIYKGIDNKPAEQLNLLIVVDQLLTGYDSKWVNTLYLDKMLQYEGLIQAFSRTNRLFGNEKRHGTICYYRRPHTMEKNINEAFKLYSGDKPFGIFVNKVDANLDQMDRIANEIKAIFKSADIRDFASLPAEKADKQKFAKLFNEYNKYYDAAKIQGFAFDETGVRANLTQQDYDALLQRYNDLAKERISDNDSLNTDIPYDIKSYITEINTGLIDANYMNNKFQKFFKALDSGDTELIEKTLNELHKSFGALSQEEQKYADVFIREVQSGDVKPDPQKTLRDYITEYMVNAQNSQIREFAASFGADLAKLNRVIEVGTEDFRFGELINSIDKQKAKEYIENFDEKTYSEFKLNIRIRAILLDFVAKQRGDKI